MAQKTEKTTQRKARSILNIDRNAKTIKSRKLGYLTGILYLAPHNASGYQVCPSASKGCILACLNTAGRGGMNCTQTARIKKTKYFFEDRENFLTDLVIDIVKLTRKAKNQNRIPACRLNGTSDLPWEKIRVIRDGENFRNIFEAFPEVQFYDYSKIVKRALKFARGEMPKNYDLTFSLTESNDVDAAKVLSAGGSVAVVFSGKDLPETFTLNGVNVPVTDGDEHDARFHDRKKIGAHIVGLYAKGKAKKDVSGFVRDPSGVFELPTSQNSVAVEFTL